jgi:hypothetical protein
MFDTQMFHRMFEISTAVVAGAFFISDGEPGDYTTYTRLDEAYAEYPTGEIIGVPRDIYSFEHDDDDVKLFRQYEATNVIIYNTDLTNAIWVENGAATVTDEDTISFNGNTNNDYVRQETSDLGFTIGDFTDALSITDLTNEFKEYSITKTAEGKTYTINCQIQAGTATSCIMQMFFRDTGEINIQFRALNEYSNDTIRVRYATLTETPYAAPIIITEADTVTVNKGVQWMPVENILKANYSFDITDSIDCNAPLIPETGNFRITFNYISSHAATANVNSLSQYVSGLTGRLLWYGKASDSSTARFFIGGSPSVVINSTANIHDGFEHFIELTRTDGSFTMTIDDVLQGSVASTTPILQTYNTIIGESPIYDSAICNIWDVNFYDADDDLIASYPLAHYREDDFVEDFSGNENHGTSSRDVNFLLSENDDYGYDVDITAPTPFTKDDVDYGIKGLFGRLEESLYLIGAGAPVEPYAYNVTGDTVQLEPDGTTTWVSTPPRDYIDGDYYYRSNGEMTNKCEVDGEPTDSTTGISGGDITTTIVEDTERGSVYKIDHISQYTTATIAGQCGNTNTHSQFVWVKALSGSVAAVFVDSTFNIITNDGEWHKVEKENITPDISARSIRFISQVVGASYLIQLPQLTESVYQYPTIPSSKDGAVTIPSQAAGTGTEGLTFPLYTETVQPFTGDADGVDITPAESGWESSYPLLYDYYDGIYHVDIGASPAPSAIVLSNSLFTVDESYEVEFEISNLSSGGSVRVDIGTNILYYSEDGVYTLRYLVSSGRLALVGASDNVTFDFEFIHSETILPLTVEQPWPFLTDDGVVKYGGLLERFGGEADGIQLFSNSDFSDGLTDWSTVGNVSEAGGKVTLTGSVNSLLWQDILTDTYTYETIIDIDSMTAGPSITDTVVIDNNGIVLFHIEDSGVHTFRHTHDATSGNLLMRAINGGIVTVNSFTTREVSPASGTLTMTIRPGFDWDTFDAETFGFVSCRESRTSIIYGQTFTAYAQMKSYDLVNILLYTWLWQKDTDYKVVLQWDNISSKFLVTIDDVVGAEYDFDGSFDPEEFIKMFYDNDELFWIKELYVTRENPAAGSVTFDDYTLHKPVGFGDDTFPSPVTWTQVGTTITGIDKDISINSGNSADSISESNSLPSSQIRRMTITVSNYVTGDVRFRQFSPGDASDIGVTDNGIYYIDYVTSSSSSRYQFFPTNGATFDFTIDSDAESIADNIVTNGSFDTDTDWTKDTGWTISSGTANCDGTQTVAAYINQEVDDLNPYNKTYFIKYTASGISAGNHRSGIGGYTWNSYESTNGTFTYLYRATNSLSNNRIYIGADSDFVGSIDNVQVYEVIVLLTKEDKTPLLYIDPFDGYIKGTDGITACLSPEALIAGASNNFIFSWDVYEFWIALNTELGVEVKYTGEITDLGNRLFALISGAYQTIRNLYFDDDFDSGENTFLSSYLASFLG